MNYISHFIFVLSLIVWPYGHGKAQNTDYATNGSFEQINSCYGNTASIGFNVFQWSGCTGWDNPRRSSTDLWCQSPIVGTIVPPYFPTIGYQYPRTGDNMAGILIGAGPNNSYYGEYAQNTLVQTLRKDYLYTIEFYLSKGSSPCAISQVGVKFYTTPFRDSVSYWTFNQVPDVQNNPTNYITDTLGWQKISLDYIANGTENYAVFGSFADSLQLGFLPTGASPCNGAGNIYPVTYLFIDDVSIIERYYAGQDPIHDSTAAIIPHPSPVTDPLIPPLAEPVIPNVFTPNSDGINELWSVDLNGKKDIRCIIFNRWGSKVFETTDQLIAWNGLTSNGQSCSDGVYYYTIYYSDPGGEKKDVKGYIHLAR